MSIQTQLYSTLPIWLQHCAVSAQGFRFRTWRNNPRRMDRYLSDLLVSQHWSAEQFLECQTVLLRQTLENAFEHVPYYRDLANELGCRAADFAAPDAFQKFPVLDKSTLRGHEGEFYATNIPGWKCWRGGTSGTTGTPLALRTTSDAMARAWAFVARLRHWAGVENPCLPRRVQFTGRNIVPGTQSRLKHVYWRHNWPGRALLMSTCHISRETIRSYVAAMTRFAPELIDGYPSALIAVVRSARFVGVELPTPRAIITTAETLEPAIKQEIEEAFRCNVFNQYAASEPSCLWGTCEAGTMHISPEYGISEILGRDGKAAKPGEEGEVVVTSFLNPAMPLIRYRLGDMAVLGAATLCACGRAMPIVECVVGRRDDKLFIPGKGYVGAFNLVLKGVLHVIEAQIIQETLDTIRVAVVADERFGSAQRETLIGNLRSKVGNDLDLHVDTVAQIDRGPNGKFHTVISKVRHLYPESF